MAQTERDIVTCPTTKAVTVREAAIIAILKDTELTTSELVSRLKNFNTAEVGGGYHKSGDKLDIVATQQFLFPVHAKEEPATGRIRVSKGTRREWQVYIDQLYAQVEQQAIWWMTATVKPANLSDDEYFPRPFEEE